MKVAILSSIAWRTPPRQYGPWEQVASYLTEGLVEKGIDVTLFATTDSVTKAKLKGTCTAPYSEDRDIDPKVAECLHISHLMESAAQFDLIHNHFDFLPLTYSKLIGTPMLTTIHGFSSPKILEVYQKYNASTHYASISNADRSDKLDYISTVYNGVDGKDFPFEMNPQDYLLFFGRIHPDKGTLEAIRIARQAGKVLLIAGLIQDDAYFEQKIQPCIDDRSVFYIGNVGSGERRTLLGKALALLHPIQFDEPFGLSVAESMFCGTPVIAYNRGSMCELISDGKTGFLVNTMDEAVQAVEKIGRIDRQECRQWAKAMFSKEKMVENYLNVYDQILSR
ncbi:Glycosyltransferase involved in cell wall bisynthesis [Dyadobacter sp. SG02]|uniref:glycosyltransferase family 4 protein n=1 Tax=Dyadobacter sp. SG02 TaxID=1855291 RepID=UPI0008CEC09F|nr:glycosyltransferase family 4 protein [Dyadobacter sp. SG02]SEJ79906.1 Glycosyltransferase involved in cell wall bisynthesis [Dyadobacter sp. SG02]